jgi:PAS domain S-box-containing protein
MAEPLDPKPADPSHTTTGNLTLRQKAEAQWQAVRQKSPNTFDDLTLRDTQTLLHDLHVHQIELEMQNEELRAAANALDTSRALFANLYELAPVGYCTVDEAGLIVQANLTLATLLGVARGALIGRRPFSDFVFQLDQDMWYRLRSTALKSDSLQTSELRLRQASASVWVQLAATTVQDDAGEPVLYVAVSDISARKLSEGKLYLAASVFEHAREGIFITDTQGIILDANDAFTRITGYSREEAIGQSPRILKSGRQGPYFYADMWATLTELGHWSGEIWNRRKNGEVFAELQTISAVRDAQGTTQQYVALFSDISAIKAHQSTLERIAHFDALTTPPNRLLLADRLQQAMSQAVRRQQHLAVAYLDLDGFKSVNDRHGHDVGDQFLIALATAWRWKAASLCCTTSPRSI